MSNAPFIINVIHFKYTAELQTQCILGAWHTSHTLPQTHSHTHTHTMLCWVAVTQQISRRADGLCFPQSSCAEQKNDFITIQSIEIKTKATYLENNPCTSQYAMFFFFFNYITVTPSPESLQSWTEASEEKGDGEGTRWGKKWETIGEEETKLWWGTVAQGHSHTHTHTHTGEERGETESGGEWMMPYAAALGFRGPRRVC